MTTTALPAYADINMFLGNNKISEDVRNKSDEELLFLSVDNPAFFELLLERYQNAFLRKALSIIKTKEDAEDIVQETFIKIYRNCDKFKPKEGASFGSWAYKILINTSLTHYQKNKRKKDMFADIPQEFYELIPEKADMLEKKNMEDYISSVFSRMPKMFSRVLRMHFIEGWGYKEIAQNEGVSEGAVKTRVYRAKKEFKKIIEKNLIK